MGDMGDFWNDIRDHKKAVRAKYGAACPQCCKEQPRRFPTILLPGQHCRVHKPHYIDPRKRLTEEELSNV